VNHISAILDFASAPHVLPPKVRADALRLLADTLAVGAAGWQEQGSAAVLNVVRSYTEGPTDDARVLGSGLWLAPISAAFLNGFQIHCLEWDAVHEPAVVHALSAVTAALLAASDRLGVSNPHQFLTSLAVGVDIASGLGLSATGPMQFFRPATAGVIGAALAVARLEGLSRDQMADVLGLAYSFAGGTMQAHVEASIALPLQIGRAAQAAVQAVDLVKAGMNGPHDVLEGQFGYSALIEPLDLSLYTSGLAKIWRISEVSIKPFPSGRASHAALATIAYIRESGRTIDRLTAYVPPLIMRLVGRPYVDDMTPAYARLCLPLLLALMLRDGRIDPRRFKAETFADPLIRELAGKVSIVLDDNPDGNALGPQRLEIAYTDGSSESISIPHTLGSPEAPMSDAHLVAKYDLCRLLAPDCDLRIFDDPLSYATDPR
jgi:2-methylcitrate dehydratase PrpD